MGKTNSNIAYQYDPETDDDQYTGGLLGRLQAMMQPGQISPATDSGSSPNGESSYGGPQDGLLGRLLALQAEQNSYEPIASGKPTPSESRDPNFRRLARVYITDRRPDGIDSISQSGGQSNPPYSPVSDRTLFDFLHMSPDNDQVLQPGHSLSGRMQAYWGHPAPYGLVSMLKTALNGAAQAVQGSIDATSVPSTEEEAFRQNQGRELGPIGALNAVSLLTPTTPAAMGGMFARPLINALRNGPASPSASARVAGYGVSRPIAIGLEDRFPAAMKLLRDAGNGDLPGFMSHPATSQTGAATLSLQNSMSLPPLPGGRFFGPSGARALPEWFAPAMSSGATILNAKKRPAPGNKPASTPTGKVSDDEDEVFDPDEAMAAYRRGVAARAAERADTFSGAYDPKNYCDERYQDEERECYKRTHEYADMSFRNGCIEAAQARRNQCIANGGRPLPGERKKWTPEEGEVFHRDFLRRLPPDKN
jgi:hypothetical protein